MSKAQKKQFRQLAELAYERELVAVLEDLEGDFKDWRSGEINVFDLSDRIHEFHQGPARDLWGVYNALEDDLLVARGLANGLLEESEVPAGLRELITKQTQFFEDQKG